MTIDEMIAVLEGARDGKVIECRVKGGTSWGDVKYPNWDFVCYDYRIKPEPMEWWVVDGLLFEDEADAKEYKRRFNRADLAIVRVREVL